jgi:hypothetical protein
MEFKTKDEVIKYVEEELDLVVITKEKYVSMMKSGDFFIFTEPGKNVLRQNGFYHTKEILQRLSGIFNGNFECRGCNHSSKENVCFICSAVKNCIKAM